MAESNLGKWYLHLTEDEAFSQQNSSTSQSESEFYRLIQLSTLIPELSSSMIPRSPERPVLLNIKTCPDYLLGHVPHPELFVIRRGHESSSPIEEYISPINIDLPITAADSFLGSPLSRKATPKSFDIDTDIENEFLNFN